MTLEQFDPNSSKAPDTGLMNNTLALIVHDLIPVGEREWAEAKRDEILSGISPDVLLARLEDGSYSMDPEYVSGYLLVIQKEVQARQTMTEQLAVVGLLARYLQSRTIPSQILAGENGPAAQHAFLDGALMALGCMGDAKLIECDFAQQKFR